MNHPEQVKAMMGNKYGVAVTVLLSCVKLSGAEWSLQDLTLKACIAPGTGDLRAHQGCQSVKKINKHCRYNLKECRADKSRLLMCFKANFQQNQPISVCLMCEEGLWRNMQYRSKGQLRHVWETDLLIPLTYLSLAFLAVTFMLSLCR